MKRLASSFFALGLALVLAAPVSSSASAASRASFAKPVQQGNAVTFNLKLKGFRIDAGNVGQANRGGTGHIHFSMDNGKYDYQAWSGENGKLAAQLGIAGKYSPSVSPTITYRNLPKGWHRLVAFLVNNDHSNAGVIAVVKFEVK